MEVGQGTGFDLLEGFFLEPELVFKVALAYLPAHLAVRAGGDIPTRGWSCVTPET